MRDFRIESHLIQLFFNLNFTDEEIYVISILENHQYLIFSKIEMIKIPTILALDDKLVGIFEVNGLLEI